MLDLFPFHYFSVQYWIMKILFNGIDLERKKFLGKRKRSKDIRYVCLNQCGYSQLFYPLYHLNYISICNSMRFKFNILIKVYNLIDLIQKIDIRAPHNRQIQFPLSTEKVSSFLKLVPKRKADI